MSVSCTSRRSTCSVRSPSLCPEHNSTTSRGINNSRCMIVLALPAALPGLRIARPLASPRLRLGRPSSRSWTRTGESRSREALERGAVSGTTRRPRHFEAGQVGRFDFARPTPDLRRYPDVAPAGFYPDAGEVQLVAASKTHWTNAHHRVKSS